MLTVDIAVQGRSIGHVTVENIGPFGDRGLEKNLYVYEYRVELDDTIRPVFEHNGRTVGRLTHLRHEGAFELASKVMAAIVS